MLRQEGLQSALGALDILHHAGALELALVGLSADNAALHRAVPGLRQRQDAIEKKASVLDRLNRKAEKMLAESRASGAAGGEPTGPLAAEVKALMEELAALRSESETTAAYRRYQPAPHTKKASGRRESAK